MQTVIQPLSQPDSLPVDVYNGGYSGLHAVTCSFFENGVTDTTPVNWQGTWRGLARGLCRDFPYDNGVPLPEGKKTLPAICGGEFKPNTTRRRDHVARVGLLLMDWDNTTEIGAGGFHVDQAGAPTNRPVMRKVQIENPVDLEQVAGALETAGVTAFLHSTWSSRPGIPRFRVVLPLMLPISTDLMPMAAEFAIQHLGLTAFRRGLDGAGLHNPAGLALMPGSVYPEYIERRFVDGSPLYIPLSRVSTMDLPRPSLASWQRELNKTRHEAGGQKWWQVYLGQGRLKDFHDLDLVGLLQSLGCWVGGSRSWGGGVKHRCTCPWHVEHTGGVDDDSAVIFMTPGHWPVWHCSHASHAHMGLRDVLELAWGRP